VRVGPHCKIRGAIFDANVEVPTNTEIGWDLEAWSGSKPEDLPPEALLRVEIHL
jgi:hypothetical protein